MYLLVNLRSQCVDAHGCSNIEDNKSIDKGILVLLLYIIRCRVGKLCGCAQFSVKSEGKLSAQTLVAHSYISRIKTVILQV